MSLAAVALLCGGLASDVAGLPGCKEGCKTATATAAAPVIPAPAKPPVVGLSPFDGAEGINPRRKPVADVINGKITSVSLTDDWGNEVPGLIGDDGKTWSPTERLQFARTYTMTVNSKNDAGIPLSRTSTFSTLVPDNYIHPYIEVQGGFAPNPDVRYGVGTIVIAHFDEAVQDKVLAEKNMLVRTDPPVAGSWNWISDSVAHWRPEHYYQPGTRINVDLNVFGLKLGDGLYGQTDARATINIGDSRVAVANDITKQVSVFDNGRLVRTMPTSMGRGGTTLVAGKTFHWWTPPGVYTVLDKGEVVTMDSQTYGIPPGNADSYKRKIGWATRISTDGIYLHQLDDTLWAQGNTNLSHGCLNLSGENAKWYFNFAQPGDIVEVRYTGGPPLTIAEGGSWGVPWTDWVKGSALSPDHAALPPPSKIETFTAPGP
ncbi:Ig-like domain-containing protein [Mycolicibacterium sp.]|uniref:L,D-transpeptidase n=1 Tax=Mycolicibacterium sp. TaxID=2320850 RepID=UPI0028AD3E95|nr:Ig-like domain-containing protein [Mycolicibacterium sp.]